MTLHLQTTIEREVRLEGIGVHFGAKAAVTLRPADANTGRVFVRSDLKSAPIAAVAANVTSSELSTILGDAQAVDGIATIEHLMAAFHGLGIDNCLVEVDGPEIPILDGSAMPFVEAILAAGIVTLDAPRRFLKVRKALRIEDKGAVLEVQPAEIGFSLSTAIDFDHPLIGRQTITLPLNPNTFVKQVARARTFGFMRDVERLWAMKRALGAGLDNTVALAEDRVLNPEGLRFPDEFVRHKALDAVGDLALAGAPIIGAFSSFKGGHRLNLAMVKALLADAGAHEWVTLPGRREDTRSRHGAPAMAAAAYRADMA